MAIKKTDTTAIKIAKPKYILATPYVGNALGTTTYSFTDVLKDSTSITQDDPTTNNIDNELSDSPIRTNTVLGNRTFTTTIEDIQADVLKDFLGFSIDSVSNKAYAPASYSDVYAEIKVVLDKDGTDYVAYILPKVQLNSKMILESLSSSMAGITLSGTAQNASVTDGSNTYSTPMCIDYDFQVPEGA